jgi:hypothetical protein
MELLDIKSKQPLKRVIVRRDIEPTRQLSKIP